MTAFLCLQNSALLLRQLAGDEAPEFVGVIDAAVGENECPLRGEEEIGGSEIAVCMVDRFPVVGQLFLAVVGVDALIVLFQRDGIDMLRTLQSLCTNLAAQGRKEKSKVDAGQTQADEQQHIAEEYSALGFGTGEAQHGTDAQNDRKQHRPAPLLPAAQQIKNGKAAEFAPAEVNFDGHGTCSLHCFLPV